MSCQCTSAGVILTKFGVSMAAPGKAAARIPVRIAQDAQTRNVFARMLVMCVTAPLLGKIAILTRHYAHHLPRCTRAAVPRQIGCGNRVTQGTVDHGSFARIPDRALARKNLAVQGVLAVWGIGFGLAERCGSVFGSRQ